jgi:hypothetical protein
MPSILSLSGSTAGSVSECGSFEVVRLRRRRVLPCSFLTAISISWSSRGLIVFFFRLGFVSFSTVTVVVLFTGDNSEVMGDDRRGRRGGGGGCK